MRLTKVIIKNFKNLDDIEIVLNPKFNFLIGENDLGKSNFLEMLDIIFNNRRFFEDSFTDRSNPIEVKFSILLTSIEKGIFEDFFDPNTNNLINIIAKQIDPDESIRFYHEESMEEIHFSRIKCINFLRYESVRLPKEELTFFKNRGVGKFLCYLVDKILGGDELIEDYIKKDSIKPIISYINDKLNKIRILKDFQLNASIGNDLTDLIYRILVIKDSKGFELQRIGHGVQFSLLIVLFILEKLMRLIEDKKRNNCIFTENNRKNISLILGLDEPEIHLHPYMQRSLMIFMDNIINNKDEQFLTLIKELYDIDQIDGQVLVVSHSPNILLNDYQYIVRFFKKDSKINICNGSSIILTQEMKKQLYKNFPYIKEAFFSRCAIIVEGDTEFGSLTVWAEKMLGNIDEFGLIIINSGGARSIPSISKLLDIMSINNVSIVDRDVYQETQQLYDSVNNLKITNKRDFEAELVENLFVNSKSELLFELIEEFDPMGLERKIEEPKINDICKKYSISITWPAKSYKFTDILKMNEDIKKAMFISWFDINKSILLGKYLGEKIDITYLPESYKTTIELAKQLAL